MPRGTEHQGARSVTGDGAPRGTALFACGRAHRAVLGTCVPGDGAGTVDEQSHALGATCPRVFARGAVSSTLVLDPTRPTGLPSRGRCRVVARSRPRREPQPGARACAPARVPSWEQHGCRRVLGRVSGSQRQTDCGSRTPGPGPPRGAAPGPGLECRWLPGSVTWHCMQSRTPAPLARAAC